MAYFRRDDNRSGGGNRSYGSGGDRGFGGGNRRSFGGGDRGPREMHKAICSNCGRECEVPFRPTGEKPVYCSDCFEKFGRDERPNRRFDDRPQRRPDFTPREQGPQNNDQFRELNAKLDRIIGLLQPKTISKPEIKTEHIEAEELLKIPEESIIDKIPAAKKKAKNPSYAPALAKAVAGKKATAGKTKKEETKQTPEKSTEEKPVV